MWLRVDEIRGVRAWRRKTKREKKNAKGEERNVYLDEKKKKKDNEKNKIKNNKKLKLRNFTTIFLQ